MLSVVATTVVAVGLPRVRRLRRVALGAPREDRLVQITRELAVEMPAEEVLPRTVRAVAEATLAGAVEIRIRSSGPDPVVTRWPLAEPPIDDGEPGVVVRPIVSHAARIGELVLRPRPTRSGRPRRFPQAERRLLDAFVGRAGLTVENVQLRAALNREVAGATRRAEEVRASRRRVVEAADAERHRLARDIHDGAQQHLVALSINLGSGSRAVRTPAGPGGGDARRAGSGGRPHPGPARRPRSGDLPRAHCRRGRRGAARAGAATSPPVTVRLPQPGLRWPSDVEAAVYFTCAEALQNATKHARAGRIEIRLDATVDTVSFAVRDDGVGFDPTSDGRGTGLPGMRDRVEAVGGVAGSVFRDRARYDGERAGAARGNGRLTMRARTSVWSLAGLAAACAIAQGWLLRARAYRCSPPPPLTRLSPS